MAASLTEDGGNSVYLSTSKGDLIQIFPTSYNVKDSCRLLGSPLENGETRFDHKALDPRTITFTGILKSPNFQIISKISNAVASQDLKECLCTFVGKGGTVKNMIIKTFEEVGDKNRYDAVEVRFTLQEYLVHQSK
ncbi:MAG: hypothetical protein J6Q22_10870 [Prevotella sp.]|nr:hypothetical protein [Prevotella sp.]